jgi:hypothetical protein
VTIRQNIDVDVLEDFRESLDRVPNAGKLHMEANAVYQGQAGRSVVHVGPFALDDTTIDRPSAEEEELIDWVMSIPAETWWEISSWAKATSNLQGWQRGIAYSLGKLVASDKPPSRKQAVQGKKLYDAAVELGFKPPTSTE